MIVATFYSGQPRPEVNPERVGSTNIPSFEMLVHDSCVVFEVDSINQHCALYKAQRARADMEQRRAGNRGQKS